MNRKLTLLVIPDDDSETRSYSFGSSFLKFSFAIIFLVLVVSIGILFLFVPKVLQYEDLNKKYDSVVHDRMEVLSLAQNLEKLIHMDEFVRNSLGVSFNFPDTPQILDSVLMVIPDNNLISLSDNIPSLAPVEGFISQRMENIFSDANKSHGGIDIVAKEGTPIKSATSGIVVFSGWTYEMGNLIIIYHGDDYFTHYGHNQHNLVSKLDRVKKGDVIGFVGDTGISSGPHLHFEVWKGEKSIDPLIYFPEYLKKDLTLRK